jgi:hypothetical protein
MNVRLVVRAYRIGGEEAGFAKFLGAEMLGDRTCSWICQWILVEYWLI